MPGDEGGERQGDAADAAHVLVFPLPAQGHVTSMLKLSEVLSLKGLFVTFLTTDHIHSRLLRYAGVASRLSRRPGLSIRSIPDGLPVDHPRSVDSLLNIWRSLSTKSRPFFRDVLMDAETPVTCVIIDGFLPALAEVPEELGIPVIAFRTSSPCSFWAYFCIPRLIDAGEIPFPEGCDMDERVRIVPGMEGFLRRRDIPSFCRVKDVNDPVMQHINESTQWTPQARGLIFNAVEAIDAPVLSHIREHCPQIYTVGPLHVILQALEYSRGDASSSNNSASFWEEDRTCMTWLDAQPQKSVVYVSFGSLTVVDRGQLLEFWHGLVNSGHRFLWVMRPDLVVGESGIPAEVAEGTRERGFMVGWAPQPEVLAHPAVGAFLTHTGWNSTLESMYEGVPMICWPFFADQVINSRYVSEVWGVGVDMKDTCDRGIVERMVREVMEGESSKEVRRAAGEVARVAKEAAGDAGSSLLSLDKLIDDIRSLKRPPKCTETN